VTISEPATLPSIPDEEFRARGERLQAAVAERGLDVLLVNSNESDFANVRYLSDYWPVFESAGVVVPPSGPLTLLIGPESETFATDRSRIDRLRLLVEYREAADPAYPEIDVASFRQVFSEAGVERPLRIGIAGSFATNLVMVESLRESFPDAKLERADDLLTELRSIKSEAEVECLRSAFRIAEDAIDVILEAVRPGMTELQVVGIAQQALYERGAEYEGMPQYVLSGPNSRHAISRASHRVLERDEVLQLNISARVAGYSSGVGRPVCLGKLPRSQRDLVEFGRDAHYKTAESLRAGVIASDVAESYRRHFVDSGRIDNFLYGPCHGLGLIEVEPPWMESISHYALEENMTFQVDTFALSDEIGCRWENGVRITADGVEWLSTHHMDVIELG
jgi:Xaa-Pro aminopeptidase